ncbi:MAG: hypothetical protein HY999_01680 [Nitrospinae bacterium]|nr:hypothetical protein [Nitrospinota bacterium]
MKFPIKYLFWILGGSLFLFSYSGSNAWIQGGSTSDNLLAIHDKDSPNYNTDCIGCHGDMQDIGTLDPYLVEAHSINMSTRMCSIPSSGNKRCWYCHRDGTDLLEKSAGNLRRNVDVAICAQCHGPKGPGKVLYLTGGGMM